MHEQQADVSAKSPETYCFIRNDRMGDLILTLPVLRAFKQLKPTARLLVVCSDENIKLARQFDFIDEVILINKPKNIKDLRLALNLLNQFAITHAFNCSPGFQNLVLLAAAQANGKSSMIYQSRYQKTSHFSKIQYRMVCELFSIRSQIVDRRSRFEKNQIIHQTAMIQKLVQATHQVEHYEALSLRKKNQSIQAAYSNRIMIHASARWLGKGYSEDDFINLIQNINRISGKVIITTDAGSSRVFHQIYRKYPSVNDGNLTKNDYLKHDIIIANELDFPNWQAMIASTKSVITYECGCVHMAALYHKKTIIVYDPDNVPEMIHAEYRPWIKNYQAIMVRRQEVNHLVLETLKTNELALPRER